jgi:hypothetical protein
MGIALGNRRTDEQKKGKSTSKCVLASDNDFFDVSMEGALRNAVGEGEGNLEGGNLDAPGCLSAEDLEGMDDVDTCGRRRTKTDETDNDVTNDTTTDDDCAHTNLEDTCGRNHHEP